MLDYQEILKKNMLNILKDILKYIQKNGLSNNNHLYITFDTQNKNVEIPKWLKNKYSHEMTIVIQFEYYDLKVYEDFFNITLSFNDIRSKLKIAYSSIISFADPSANFGLKIKEDNNQNKKNIKEKKSKSKSNILSFPGVKKNYSKK